MPLVVGGGAPKPPTHPGTTTSTPFGTVPTFPTDPVPLSAADVAEFAERGAFAERRFADAVARRNAGTGRAKAQFELALKRMDRDQGKDKRTLANTLAGRSQAFQPRFMGRGLVELRDDYADRKAQARAGLADETSRLGEAARLAELEMHEERAAIARDRARRQSALDALIRPLAGI